MHRQHRRPGSWTERERQTKRFWRSLTPQERANLAQIAANHPDLPERILARDLR